jgi:hypothetical protein
MNVMYQMIDILIHAYMFIYLFIYIFQANKPPPPKLQQCQNANY